MQIVYPNTKEIKSYTGPGGYQAELFSLEMVPEKKIGFYRIRIPKGSECSAHFHKQCKEIFYLLSKMEIHLNGKTIQGEPGMLLVMDRGDTHALYAKESDAHCIAVKFPLVDGDKFLGDSV